MKLADLSIRIDAEYLAFQVMKQALEAILTRYETEAVFTVQDAVEEARAGMDGARGLMGDDF